ncbi:MAG TPA: N-acetylmuramoyl-L-alanine amidase [Ureibacillus sp.]|nr:N-acetylmuramoyl-L-alanine amidase [Ureibacillus sp.]
MVVVMLDYGHGGKDPGAVYQGRKEADDVLKLGMAVAKKLRSVGINVKETRKSDNFLSLEERSNYERKVRPHYFISLHRNAFKPEHASGVETFVYLTNNTQSGEVAKEIQNRLVKIGFKNRGVKKANFHVLRETYAPAVLIEVGFIDNSIDNKIFDSKFDKMVDAIAEGIIEGIGLQVTKQDLSC